MRKPVFLTRINQTFMVVAAFWALLLAVNIALDVFGRVVFNSPVLGTTEAVTNSIVMIAFLQLPYAVFSRSMLRADFLLSVLPGRLSRIFTFIGACLGAALFGLLVYGIFDPMLTAYARGEFVGEGTVRIPVWPIYVVILTGAALTTLNYLIEAAMLLIDDGEV